MRPQVMNGDGSPRGSALDLRIAGVGCKDVKGLLKERTGLLARVGCFPGASFFHVDAGRSRSPLPRQQSRQRARNQVPHDSLLSEHESRSGKVPVRPALLPLDLERF
jgi:hypothetical protein